MFTWKKIFIKMFDLMGHGHSVQNLTLVQVQVSALFIEYSLSNMCLLVDAFILISYRILNCNTCTFVLVDISWWMSLFYSWWILMRTPYMFCWILQSTMHRRIFPWLSSKVVCSLCLYLLWVVLCNWPISSSPCEFFEIHIMLHYTE